MVAVLLPNTNINGFSVEEAKQLAKSAFSNSKRIQVEHPQADESRNSFAIFVYASVGVSKLEDVASFDYWREEPEVTRHLKLLEDGPKGMFNAGDLTGVGYTDPFFVHNERARSVRWRPWVPEGDSMQHTRALEALHFALLKNNLPESDWPLPLLIEGRQRYFYLVRSSIDWEKGAKVERRDCPWKLNDKGKATLGQGIDEVFAALSAEKSDWCDEILMEAGNYWKEIALAAGFTKGTDSYRRLIDGQLDFIHKQREKTLSEESQHVVWQKLYRHVESKLR